MAAGTPAPWAEKWKQRRPGRPRQGAQRALLEQNGSATALRLLLWRSGLQEADFARELGVSRSTLSRWLNGVRSAPPTDELRAALQVAGRQRYVTPIPDPSLRVRPFGHLGEGWFPRAAARAVQKHIIGGFEPPHQDPVILLDRVAAVFEPRSRSEYVAFLKATCRHLPTSPEYPFNLSFASNYDLHVSVGPRFPGVRVHPDTGEILDKSFARIDISGRLLQKRELVIQLLQHLVHRHLEPDSLEVTLLDIAVDYAVPSLAVLHHDTRVQKVRLRCPDHRWLMNEAVNTYLGSKNSSRFIRTYDKVIERCDKLLRSRGGLEDRVRRKTLEFFAGFDEDLLPAGAFEPERDDVVLDLRTDPDLREEWPPHLDRFWNVHRIEASVRPRPLSSGGIDRRPEGLIQGVLDRVNPFGTLWTIHLGLVDPGSFWMPIMLWSRVEGTRRILNDIVQNERGSRSGRSGPEQFLDELERLAEATEGNGLEHPDVVLRMHVDQLQKDLDDLVGPRFEAPF